MSKFGLFRRWAVAPFLASMVIVMGAIAATASYAPSHRQLSVQVQVLAPHGVYAHAIAAYVVVHGRGWAHTRRPANGEPFTKTAAARFATTESFAAEGGSGARSLFHYTNEEGQSGILESQQLNPSLKTVNPSDARYGNGQYLSDIEPGTYSNASLSSRFLRNPYQGARFSHYVEIDVTGLDVVEGRGFLGRGRTNADLSQGALPHRDPWPCSARPCGGWAVSS